jgi:hypothetical protein
MTKRTSRDTLLLALLLFYSLFAMYWGLTQTPLTPNEARGIYMGRALLTEGILACTGLPDKNRPIAEIMCENQGSVAIAPLVIAAADRFAGLSAARSVGLLLCLCLVVLIYHIGNTPFHGKRGLLAAAAFVFMGFPLQLSPTATADAVAALFFCASLWLAESAAGDRSVHERAFMLMAGALSLALAVMTNYIAVLLVSSVVLYVFHRHRVAETSVFFLLPLLFVLSLYGYFALVPAWPSLSKSMHFHSLKFEYIYEWLALPYLLATFGIFSKEGGEKAFYLILLSAPVFLASIMSYDISSIHSAVLFSLIFLAPAAAMGIGHMGDLFSSNNPASFVKPLFVSAILVVIFIFGLQQIRKVRKDYPDLSPAVTFVLEKGSSGITVLVDSDYGYPEYVYRYFLESEKPAARVVPITRANDKEREEVLAKVAPDFVILDEYHSDRSFNRASLEYLSRGFRMVKTYQMTHSSGIKNIRIFQKEAL